MRIVKIIALAFILALPGCAKSLKVSREIADKAVKAVTQVKTDVDLIAKNYLTLLKGSLAVSKLPADKKKEILDKATALVTKAKKHVDAAYKIVTLVKEVIHALGGDDK